MTAGRDIKYFIVCQIPIFVIVCFMQVIVFSQKYIFALDGTTLQNMFYVLILLQGFIALVLILFSVYRMLKHNEHIWMPATLIQCMGLVWYLCSFYAYISVLRDMASWHPNCLQGYYISLGAAIFYVIGYQIAVRDAKKTTRVDSASEAVLKRSDQ